MVALVPAQISKPRPRLPASALRHPLPTLPTAHYLLPTIPLCALCAPHSVPSVLRFSPSSGAQARQRPPTAHYPPLTTHSPLTTFRMNTCKSVSKQSTLTGIVYLSSLVYLLLAVTGLCVAIVLGLVYKRVGDFAIGINHQGFVRFVPVKNISIDYPYGEDSDFVAASNCFVPGLQVAEYLEGIKSHIIIARRKHKVSFPNLQEGQILREVSLAPWNSFRGELISGDNSRRSSAIDNFQPIIEPWTSALQFYFYPCTFAINQRIGAFFGGLNGSLELKSLNCKDDQLKTTDYRENGGDGDEFSSKVDEFPVIRRSLFAFFSLLIVFGLSLRGWKTFYNKRRFLGATLVTAGWLLGTSGLTLLWLSDFPSTWGWIL
jgi:hypothetical protein